MSLDIITISGVDCSGKSTQVNLLKKYLESNGSKVYYFHAISFSLANKNKKFVAGKSPAVTKASWLKIQIRKIILLIDLFRFNVLIKSLKKSGYSYLVSDRYFHDSIVNILYLSNNKYYNSFGVTFISYFVKKTNHAFYIDITIDEILKRERNIEQGVEYLEKKISIYKSILKKWNIQSINGINSKKNIALNLQKKIN